MLWRVVVWTLAGGGMLGGLYGPLGLCIAALVGPFGFLVAGSLNTTMFGIELFIGFFAGIAYGAFVWLFVGVVDGLALSVLARPGAGSHQAALENRHLGAIVSATVGGSSAFAAFTWIGPPFAEYRGGVRLSWLEIGFSPSWFLWVVIPAVIAACYGWWVGNRAAPWLSHRGETSVGPSLPL